jgi:hypothetical protein
MTGTNVWGTPRDAVDVDEFCRECEHEVGGHYTGCPTRATWINRATYPPPVPAGTYNGRGWQFYVFEFEGWAHVEAWRPDGTRFYAPSPHRDRAAAATTIARRNPGALVAVVGADEVARFVRAMDADRRRHDASV